MAKNPALDPFRDALRVRGQAVADLTDQLDAARAELRLAVSEALEAGVSELESSKLAGVTRDSIRRWAGK